MGNVPSLMAMPLYGLHSNLSGYMTDVDVNTVPICTEERLLSANGTSALVSYSAPGIGSHVVYRITL